MAAARRCGRLLEAARRKAKFFRSCASSSGCCPASWQTSLSFVLNCDSQSLCGARKPSAIQNCNAIRSDNELGSPGRSRGFSLRRAAEHADVCYWPKADMTLRDSDVRFRGQSGHHQPRRRLPLLTQSGHPALGTKPTICLGLGTDVNRSEAHAKTRKSGSNRGR